MTDPTGTGAIPQEAVDATARAISRHLAGFHTEPSPTTVKVAEVALAAALPILRAQWHASLGTLNRVYSIAEIDRLTADLAAARQQLDAVRAYLADKLRTAERLYGTVTASSVRAGSVADVLAALAVAPTDAPATCVHEWIEGDDEEPDYCQLCTAVRDAPATKDGQ